MSSFKDIDQNPLHTPLMSGTNRAINVFVFVLEMLFGVFFIVFRAHVPRRWLPGMSSRTQRFKAFLDHHEWSGMPSFGKTHTDEQIWTIIAIVKNYQK